MSYRKEAIWTAPQSTYLTANFGRLPRAKLAAVLGRSETAVQVKAKRMKLPSPRSWQHIFLSGGLSSALGVDEKTAIGLMKKGVLPIHIVYLGNKPVPAVNVARLQRWLADPLNWYCLDIRKVKDPRLASVIQATERHWCDEWLTVGRVCALRYVVHQTVNNAIHAGRLPAVRHGNWRILRSQAQALQVG